jgi:hypothetical protein
MIELQLLDKFRKVICTNTPGHFKRPGVPLAIDCCWRRLRAAQHFLEMNRVIMICPGVQL